MTVYFSSPYGRIDVEPENAMVRYTRTSLPFPTTIELEICHENVARALDRLGRGRHALLVDLREVRAASASGLDQAQMRGRRRLFSGFLRVGVLVKTAASAVQVLELARVDGLEVRAFQDDEAGALAFVRSSSMIPTSERLPPRSGVVETVPVSVRPPASWPAAKLGR